MKKLSRLLAVVLAVLMLAACFVGCHDKGEIAFTIGESKFTSAFFSCTQFFAANSARSAIDAYISENKLDNKNVDYEDYKFDKDGNVAKDGTPYETFVREQAIKTLRENAALDALMKAEKLELDEDTLNAATAEAWSVWNYGCDYNTYYQYAQMGMANQLYQYYTPYGLILETNGVGYETYLEYRKYDAKYDFYFNHLYDEDGKKAVSKDDVTKYMTEHFAMGDKITFSKKGSDNKTLSDEKLKALKAIADGYAERLNAGEDFKTINDEETKRLEEEKKANSSSSSSTTTSSNTSSTASGNASSATSSGAASTDSASTNSTSSSTTSSGDKKYSPESYKGLYGDEDSGYNDALFSEYKKQEIGKAVVIDDTTNSQYILFVKRDMLDEEYEDYWYDGLRSNILYILKQDEYDASLKEKGDGLTLTEDTHATSPFDVDEIKFELED